MYTCIFLSKGWSSLIWSVWAAIQFVIGILFAQVIVFIPRDGHSFVFDINSDTCWSSIRAIKQKWFLFQLNVCICILWDERQVYWDVLISWYQELKFSCTVALIYLGNRSARVMLVGVRGVRIATTIWDWYRSIVSDNMCEDRYASAHALMPSPSGLS